MRKKKAEVPEDCMPKCATCAFAEFDVQGGACHRYPPQFVSDDEACGFVFPAILPVEWCGEYKRRCDA